MDNATATTSTARPESAAKPPSSNRGRTDTVSSTEITAASTSYFNDADDAVAAHYPKPEGVPRWFPRCCGGKPILHGKPEALGWLFGMMGQTVGLLGVGTFVVPALLYFAKLEAGCEVEIPEGETELPECNNTVYGLKPSSMITTLASILSVCVAVMTPLMGAIIDYTPYRRAIGRTLAFFYCCLVMPQVFLSENTWFPLTICILLMAMNSIALTLCLHSYLPELTDSEEELNDLTKHFTAVPGANVTIFIVAVIGTSVAMGVEGEEGPMARVAAVFGIIVLATCFTLAWGFLLGERPALNVLEEGQSLLTSGFKEIHRTTTRLYRTNIALLWFYAAVALGDVKPLTGIVLAFMSGQQQFTSADVGIAAITIMFSVIPGAILSSFMCRRVNPVRSSVLAVTFMIIVTSAASIFLTGPNQKLQTFAFIACWGIAGGWKVTSTSMLVAAIVPEGHDAELMGFYLFAENSLSWFPPIIYTALNEAGLSERVGLSSISIFFILALGAYWKMGHYDDCVKIANRLVFTPGDSVNATTKDDDDDPVTSPSAASEVSSKSLPVEDKMEDSASPSALEVSSKSLPAEAEIEDKVCKVHGT